MIRLERLTIHKLNHIAPGTELLFGSDRVVLLGRNGTGKTTLLNLIVSLVAGEWTTLSASDYSLSCVFRVWKPGEDISIELNISSKAQAPLSSGSRLEDILRAANMSSNLEPPEQTSTSTHPWGGATKEVEINISV